MDHISQALSKETPVGEKSELFIGLVGAVGIDLDIVFNNIKEILEKFNYDVHQIKISDFFYDSYFKEKYQIDIGEKNKNNTDIFQETYSEIEGKDPKKSMLEHDEFPNIYLKMEAGNKIRKNNKNKEDKESWSILARCAIQKIQKLRDQNEEKKKGVAYIFQSLKHPEESKLLSKVYGPGYYQIGIYLEEEYRIKFLEDKKQMDENDAKKLIEKDVDEENKPYGQKTRDTFQLSDFFIKQYPKQEADKKELEREKEKKELERIFDLIFGHPYKTPTKDEHAMYMAYAYSARSADLSRQVGAVVCNESGDIIGLGSNDVPCFGGGPYWPDPYNDDKEDWRDYRYIQGEWKRDDIEKGQAGGRDANQVNRDQIMEEIITICRNDLKIDQNQTENKVSKFDIDKIHAEIIRDLKEKIRNDLKQKLLKETGISDIKGFGRPTHAEMSALLSCTRNGVSPKDGTIYCTTFPCHNCTRHIIDAGIKRVVFVEPYPSSKAKLLHSDSISIEKIDNENKKIIFEHFIGVAARRYLDLFSLKLGMGNPIERKDREGKTIDWSSKPKEVRVPLVVMSYLDHENKALSKL